MAVMAGHNAVNPRYALTSITYSHTLMEKGPRVRNIETIWFLPLRVIGKANILLLQNNNDGLFIYRGKLKELYIIN